MWQILSTMFASPRGFKPVFATTERHSADERAAGTPFAVLMAQHRWSQS